MPLRDFSGTLLQCSLIDVVVVAKISIDSGPEDGAKDTTEETVIRHKGRVTRTAYGNYCGPVLPIFPMGGNPRTQRKYTTFSRAMTFHMRTDFQDTIILQKLKRQTCLLSSMQNRNSRTLSGNIISCNIDEIFSVRL